MRKQLATVAQALNFEKAEIHKLSKHLGHDYGIHIDFYQFPDPIIQLAQESKLLLAVSDSTIDKYRGKSTKEIFVNLEEEEIGWEEIRDPEHRDLQVEEEIAPPIQTQQPPQQGPSSEPSEEAPDPPEAEEKPKEAMNLSGKGSGKPERRGSQKERPQSLEKGLHGEADKCRRGVRGGV